MNGVSRKLIVLLGMGLCLAPRVLAADAAVTLTGASGSSSGSLTIAFQDTPGNAFTETVPYGPYSTPASLASAFGAKFSKDYIASGLCAHAVGAVLYLHLKGADTFNLPLTLSSSTGPFTVTFNPPPPALAWVPPAPITRPAALSAAQLDAQVSVAGVLTACPISTAPAQPGTCYYTPQSGAVLPAGPQTLTVVYTPPTGSGFAPLTTSVTLNVLKTTPVITWPAPAAIPDTTLLGVAQFNANANVAGAFTYTNEAGKVLANSTTTGSGAPSLTIVGSPQLTAGEQMLFAAFIPSDAADYASLNLSVPITVTGAAYDTGTVTLTVGGTTVSTASYGQGDTPSTVAEKLTASTTQVAVTAVDDALYIEAKTTAIDLSYSLQATSWNSTLFAEPSFVPTPVTGNLEGGSASTTTTGLPVYTYTVPAGGYDPAGNLLAYADTVMGSWNFAYDTLNRLASAADSVSGLSLTPPGVTPYYCWAYDDFGNRTVQSPQSTPCPIQSASQWVFGANNQVTGVIAPGGSQPSPSPLNYDQAGDVVGDATTGNQYLYDAEGRICAVSALPGLGGFTMTGYLYDADGIRVAKGLLTAWSCDPSQNGFQTTTDFTLGLGGEQLSEIGVNVGTPSAGSASTASATISGTLLSGMNGAFIVLIGTLPNGESCVIDVNFGAGETGGTTSASIAAAIASQASCGGLITAAANGPVVTFTSTTVGSAANYTFSASLAGCNCSQSNPTTGLSISSSGAAMTGGTNAVTMGLTWQHTNVWAGGKLLGTYDADGLHFYLDDPLGTRRAQTDAAGVLEQTCVSLPYGDGLSCENPSGSPYFPSTQYPTEHHFTGKERDAESGNDYFGARYYASSMGRFMSPDPLPWLKWQNSGGDSTGKDSERKKFNEWIEDPQHLNMYAYVRNNPLTRTDPTGMAECSYSISGHTLVCTSNKPSAKLSGNQHEVDTVGPEGVFSGLGEKQNQLRFEFDRNGPIPEGRYKMNEYFIDSHDRFRLEPWPNDRMSRIFRYAHHFRFDGLGAQLHHGHVSDGCINVSEDSPHAMQQFGKVLDLLKKEDGKNYLTVTK